MYLNERLTDVIPAELPPEVIAALRPPVLVQPPHMTVSPRITVVFFHEEDSSFYPAPYVAAPITAEQVKENRWALVRALAKTVDFMSPDPHPSSVSTNDVWTYFDCNQCAMGHAARLFGVNDLLKNVTRVKASVPSAFSHLLGLTMKDAADIFLRYGTIHNISPTAADISAAILNAPISV